MLDCIIVGGNSPIGSALTQRLRADGMSVVSTTRRLEYQENEFQFDLADPSAQILLPEARTVAIVAAETQFTACSEDPFGTRLVNVLAPARVAQWAFSRGARVLFFSSISVYDGSIDAPCEDSLPHPDSIYGAQKLEAENALARLAARWRGAELAIIRPAKVIIPGFTLFTEWCNALSNGDHVEPFIDMRIAPIWLDRLIVLAVALTKAGAPTGVFQISAHDEVNYADLADRIANNLGFPLHLIFPCSAKDKLGGTSLWLPQHARLGVSRLAELGLSAPTWSEAVDLFLADHQVGKNEQ